MIGTYHSPYTTTMSILPLRPSYLIPKPPTPTSTMERRRSSLARLKICPSRKLRIPKRKICQVRMNEVSKRSLPKAQRFSTPSCSPPLCHFKRRSCSMPTPPILKRPTESTLRRTWLAVHRPPQPCLTRQPHCLQFHKLQQPLPVLQPRSKR